MGRKNKWHTRGQLQFKRMTKRLSDGTPDGDVLYIRVRGKACVFATLGPAFPHNRIEFWANDGLYFQPLNPVQAANRLRSGLMQKLERAQQ